MTDPMTTNPAPDPALIEQLVAVVYRDVGDVGENVTWEEIERSITQALAASDVLLVRRSAYEVIARAAEQQMERLMASYERYPDRYHVFDREAADAIRAALSGGEADDAVFDPNTPEGGNETFDPREWIDEETGVPFMEADDAV